MAALTISDILERIKTLLEAAPLSLVSTGDPFSPKGVPNDLVNTSFSVVSGGMVSSRSTSNFQALRVDRVTVTLFRQIAFDAYTAQSDLQDLLDDVERAIIADGPEQGYMVTVEKGSRKITRPKDSDVCVASLNLLCDYDFNEAAS